MSQTLCNISTFKKFGLGSSLSGKATVVIEHLIKLQMSLKLSNISAFAQIGMNGSSLNGKAKIMIEH